MNRVNCGTNIRRQELFETGITTLSFCFEDFYRGADRDMRGRIDQLSDDELERFIEEYQCELADDLRTAIDSDLEFVYNDVIERSLDAFILIREGIEK